MPYKQNVPSNERAYSFGSAAERTVERCTFDHDFLQPVLMHGFAMTFTYFSPRK
jgi:hypothetical protein